jgi:hypothetical protein
MCGLIVAFWFVRHVPEMNETGTNPEISGI